MLRTLGWGALDQIQTNLLDEFPGRNGKGTLWDPEKARGAAESCLERLRGRRVLFLGRRVAKAFGFGKEDLPPLSWRQAVPEGSVLGVRTGRRVRFARVAVIPHPSGINAWYNSEENRELASRFLRRLFGTEESNGQET